MEKLKWRVHTVGLLKEIMVNNEVNILKIPINIFGKLLFKVAERASEINDSELNKLMLRLTLYNIADPESDEYNEEFVQKYLGTEVSK